MTTIEKLKAHIAATGIKLPVIVKATGIPTERIRKWLEGKGNPKTEDTKLLESYLSGNKHTEEVTATVDPNNPHPSSLSKDETIAILVRQVANLNDLSRRLVALEQIAKANHDILSRLTTTDEKIVEERPAYTKRGASSAAKK